MKSLETRRKEGARLGEASALRAFPNVRFVSLVLSHKVAVVHRGEHWGVPSILTLED